MLEAHVKSGRWMPRVGDDVRVLSSSLPPPNSRVVSLLPLLVFYVFFTRVYLWNASCLSFTRKSSFSSPMPCPARQGLLEELGSFFFNCYLSLLPSCELLCSSILYSNERKPLKTNHPTNKQGRKRKKKRKKRYECSKAGTKAWRFSLISTFDFFFFRDAEAFRF